MQNFTAQLVDGHICRHLKKKGFGIRQPIQIVKGIQAADRRPEQYPQHLHGFSYGELRKRTSAELCSLTSLSTTSLFL